MEMNQQNLLNTQNPGKDGKEINDLKSRRVLTDLLDKQIDLNEQLAQENSTLIVDQQKLLGLLESKDKVIEEIKASSFQGGCSTERVAHFQNKAQMMADHGWQMLLERVLRGSEILRALERRKNITEKMSFFQGLHRIANNQVIQEQFMKLERRDAQNQLLRLLAFVRTVGTLRRNRKVWGFTKILNVQKSDQNSSKKELISKVFIERLLAEKKAKEGRITEKKIRKISAGNRLTGNQKYGIHLKDEVEGNKKGEKKQVQIRDILKKKVIKQTESIKELIKRGGMSQEQVADFIQKTQVIVSNIQNSYNQKCAEYDQIQAEKQEIEEKWREAEEILKEKEEDSENQKCVLQEAEENRRQFEEQAMDYAKQNQQLRNHLGNLQQLQLEQEESSLKKIQELEQQVLLLKEQLNSGQEEIEGISELRHQIKELQQEIDQNQEMIQNKNEEIIQLKEKEEEQCKAWRYQAEEEKRDWNERLRTLQAEFNLVLGKQEIMKQLLQQKEIENLNLKKNQDKQRQNQSLEIDQKNEFLMQKVDHLEAEKQDLINNLELTVNRLKDLKDNYDKLHQDKEKFREELGKAQKENQKIHAELDSKNRTMQEQQQAIEKMSLFMNKNNQQDNAKYERIIREKEEMETNYQQIKGQYQQLQTLNNNLKKMNTDLTKEAIQINEEKIYLNETIEESEAELKKKGSEISTLKQNIQKLQQKLEEKNIALQQSTIQPQAFAKLTQEYEEILEENAALKRELLRLDEINKEKELNEVNLTQKLNTLIANEEQHKEEIKEINANMAVLTREKLNHFKENSSQHHEIQRLKAKNKALKEGHIEYQKQIQEYDEQLQNTYQVLRIMEERVKQNEGKYREQSVEAANEIDALRNNSMRKRSRSNSQNVKSTSEYGQDNDLMLIQKIDSLKNQSQKSSK